MVSETIFIVKFNTRLKMHENSTVLITFDRVVRSSISFPHWKGILDTFLTICYLTGLVAKTTLLGNLRFFFNTVLFT